MSPQVSAVLEPLAAAIDGLDLPVDGQVLSEALGLADRLNAKLVAAVAVKPLARPVTLAEMRSEPKLADFLLLRHSRLSVVPVSAAHWKLLCKLGATEA